MTCLTRMNGAASTLFRSKPGPLRRAISVVGILVALLPSAHLAYVSRDLPYLGQFQDDGIYSNAARSLAEGHGYRIQSLPDEPFQTKYPPLFPLVLAGIYRPGVPSSETDSMAMLFAWSMLPLCVLLAVRTGADLGLGTHTRVVLALVLALNPVAALLATNLLSELMFCCLLFSSLIVSELSLKQDSAGLAMAAGGFAGLACLTRSAGLPLVLSALVYFALKRRSRMALYYAVGSLPSVLVWNLWAHVHRSRLADILYYTDYLGFHLHTVSFRDIPRLVLVNLRHLVCSAGGLIVFNLYDKTYERFLGAILGLIAIAALIGLARHSGIRQYHLFALAYGLVLILWNFPPTERFLFPVAPALISGLLSGFSRFRKSFTVAWNSGHMMRLWSLGVACVFLALLGFATSNTAAAFTREFPAYSLQQREFRDSCNRAYQWVRDNTPWQSRFLAYYDTSLYLATGHHAQRLLFPMLPFYTGNRTPIANEIRDLAAFARSHQFSYYFSTRADYRWGELFPQERRSLERALSESSDFERVYERDGISIFRVSTSTR